MAEHAYKLAPLIIKQQVDETLLNFYELLMRDHEAEVRSESVGNISKIAKYCSESLLIEKVIPIIQDQISKDPSQHVKGSLAQSVCQMTEWLSQEQTVQHILPPVFEILKESATEVRVSLLQNITVLSKTLTEENLIKHILPEIEKLSKDKTWRVRLASISFCPVIAHYISLENFEKYV